MRIECVAYGVGIPVSGKVDVGNLRACMDAGIGTTGTLHQRFIARECFNCRREGALNGELVGLNLPAGKWAPVIFDRQLVARHVTPPACWISLACRAGTHTPPSAGYLRAGLSLD